MKYRFMTGPYKVVIGEDLEKIQVVNQKFYFDSQKISGTILLTILAPQTLLHPFLLYKTRAGRTILTLCKMCCETLSKRCSHSDQQRALTGSYLLSEIEFAHSLGYRILDIFECHAYFKEYFIFKPFVEALNHFKQINAKNPAKRNFYKLAANSLFGKIAQRNDFKKTLYVSSQNELEDLYLCNGDLEHPFFIQLQNY